MVVTDGGSVLNLVLKAQILKHLRQPVNLNRDRHTVAALAPTTFYKPTRVQEFTVCKLPHLHT